MIFVGLGLFVAGADTMVSGIFVTIANDFSGPIRDLVVTDPRGKTFAFENIEPGSRHASRPGLSGEGTVEFSMTASGLVHRGILIGDITPSMGVRAELRLTADGQVEVSESFGRISLGELPRFCHRGVPRGPILRLGGLKIVFQQPARE